MGLITAPSWQAASGLFDEYRNHYGQSSDGDERTRGWLTDMVRSGMLTVYTDRQEFTLAYHRALRQSMKPPHTSPSSASSPASVAAPVSTATPPPSQTSAGVSSSATGSSPGASHEEPVRPPRSIR